MAQFIDWGNIDGLALLGYLMGRMASKECMLAT